MKSSVEAAGVQSPGSDRGEKTSTGADLLRFAGTWQGDDFEECLQEVYAQRKFPKRAGSPDS